MFKRGTGLAVPYILIEKQIGQRRDDQHVGGLRRKNSGDAPDEFGRVKTGKGPCDANETVQLGWFKIALSGKPGDEQGLIWFAPSRYKTRFRLSRILGRK